MTKLVAARAAREIALLPAHAEVDSSMKIAAKYGVSDTIAVRARNLLRDAGLIYKSGRRYRKTALPHNGNGTEG
jgi:hypothetical protein